MQSIWGIGGEIHIPAAKVKLACSEYELVRAICRTGCVCYYIVSIPYHIFLTFLACSPFTPFLSEHIRFKPCAFRKMRLLLSLAPLIGLAYSASRTTAPSGALVVGDDGDYSTIQDAVDALSSSSSDEQSIFISAGTYKEQVYVKALSGPVTIYGYTEDTTSYSSNEVTITYGLSQEDVDNNDATATLRVWTSNFKLYNVNVVNSYGEGSQALALSAYAEVSWMCINE